MDRNTSPISPFSEGDYIKAYRETSPNLYPEKEIGRFKNIYGKLNDFKTDEIELANGSDEWLQKLMITLGKGGVMTLMPDFGMYRTYANQIGIPFYQVNCNKNYEFDFERIVEEIKEINPTLFILSNPHNPTSVMFSESNLNLIAQTMEEINGYFVIDEAYIEFGKDYERPQGDHVIILRTMSKIYGMAGLRIGIIRAVNETYNKLTSINHPYPLNSLNLNLASEFLENKDLRFQFASYQKESKEKLVETFHMVKDLISIKPSSSNFVFTYGKKAEDLGVFLKEKGFKGRFYGDIGLKDAVRYSIVELDAYPKLMNCIKEWRKNQ